MKKFLFSMICTLLPILASAQLQDEELKPYAVLDGNTLTFYYDDQKEARSGMDIGPFSTDTDREWADQCESIEIVTFYESFKSYMPTSTSYWFYGCTNLTEINNLENLMTDNVENMWGMFYGCSSLTSLDLSGFNTDKVKDMDSMFNGCSSLTSLNLSSFNTSLVGSMGYMFSGCSSLTSLDLSSFDTPEVEYMGWMFQGCSSLKTLDLSSFDTSKVIDMGLMFSHCSNLETIWVSDSWTDNGNEGNLMFELCEKLVGGQGTVYDADHINASYAHIDEGATNPGYLTDPSQPLPYAVLSENNTVLTFYYDNQKAAQGGMGLGPFTESTQRGWDGYAYNIQSIAFDESFANCTTITSTKYWFAGITNLTTLTGLDNLKTENVTDMSYMFSGCSSLTNLDLSSFTTSSVTDMQFMFSQCSGLETIYVGNGWSLESISSQQYGAEMFAGCTALVGGAGTIYDPDHVNVDYAHIDGGSSSPGYLSGAGQAAPYAALSDNNTVITFYYDDQKVKRDGMSVGPFTAYEERGWNEQSEIIEQVVFDDSFAEYKPTSTRYWFYNFRILTGIPTLEKLKTDNVTDMSNMFMYCEGLTSLDVSKFETSNVTNMWSMFNGCSKLTNLDVSKFQTTKATSLGYMFSGCSELTSLDVSGFDTSNTTYMNGMFHNCSSLESLDVSHFETSKVTSMLGIFHNCSSLTSLDVTNFNTSNVTNMNSMFGGCSKLTNIDVSGFDTSNATDMRGMFYDCSSLTSLDVTNFNTSNVTTMNAMFGVCSKLTNLDLSNFNTSNVTDMQLMFSQCSELETISVGNGWSLESISSQQYGADMFTECTALVGGAGTTYDPDHVNVDYAHIDGGATNPGYLSGSGQVVPYAVLNEDNSVLTFYYDDLKATRGGMKIVPFDEAVDTPWYDNKTTIKKAVIDESFADYTTLPSTAEWFSGMSNLIGITGLSNLKTDNVTDMSSMFSGCSSLKALDLGSFNTKNVENMAAMFFMCSSLESLNVSSFNTQNVTNMQNLFQSCSSLTSLDVTSFDTHNVENMANMFDTCSNLTSIDLSHFNTENVKNMNYMFVHCTSLTSLDLTSFDTHNVESMNGTFSVCSGLKSLDLSNFETSKVTNTNEMFFYCENLATIYVSNGWTTANVTDSGIMFTNCLSLVGGRGTKYNSSHIDAEYAHIDGGTSNPGYLTDINGPLPYAVLSENNTILTFYYDDQKAARNGMSVGPFTSTDSREWKDDVTTITYVEFDSSFADCTSITSTARWFDGCSNLTEISGISYLHTENVTSMRRMFKDCSGLTGIDLSHFNTENVTKMDYMFDGCSGLNKLDVSGFNTGNVTEMGSMFANCSSLKSLDVTGFNTESVTDISRMFYSCSGLTTLDLSNFNTANAKEDLSNLFRNCSSLMTIYVGSGWTTDNMTNGENMFLNCTNLEGGAGTKYDTNHTDHAYAHIDGGTSNPGYLTGPSQPRPYAVLSGNNTVLTFYYDDQKATRGGMDVGPFEQWGGQGTKSGWSDVNEQITTVVFNNSFANFTKLTSTAYWFYGCENLTTITGMSNLKTDNVTDINSMFGDCHSLKSIDFSSLNLSNVTNMHQVFEDCRALESINFSGVNTENVTNMGDLFLNCKSLKTIDISSFNTKNVTKMTSMFYKCDVLTTIYVGEGWTTENVTESGEMFEKSPNLVGGRGTTYDENHIGIEYAHIDGGTSNPGYLTDINGASEETWAKLQSRIEYGTDVLSKAKEISSVDQALIEKLDEALQNANQMYKIHEASEEEVLNMIEVLNERINDVEEAMNQPASEETWTELKATIEYGTDVLSKAKESSTVDQWLIEELEMTLDSGNQMYKIHEASEEEVLNMIDELNWRIKEVEEAMNQPASDEAWAELNKAVETGEKLQTEAKGVSTVEPWALEELENMTTKGSEMYKVHTAGEEEVRHMTEELNQIINEVEEMMRKQPQGEASFDGLTAYVSGNATLDDAFKSVGGRSEAAKTIAAIVWNADNALTADMLSGIDNPNLLVFVTEASKAPSGVQNVVIDGVAAEIVLTDATGNNNFYCPQSFTAKSISYSRDFSQTTEIDVCRGWETIALPFDVQSITHESHGALVPFGGSDNGYPFWLRQLSTNGLARATKIEANRPYLICMPNNIIYPPEYNQNGTVTFSSSNVTVPVTSARSSTSAGVTFHATFQQVTKSSSVYALNVGETRGEYPEGSVFEQNYRDIRPFQAYTTHSAGTRSFITLESIGGNDDATGIEELRIKNSEFGDAEGVWYSLDGRRLDAKPTKKGVYVKDGRKIVIK